MLVAANSAARVLIVGAGPAGAALAYLLARRGIRVILLERQVDFTREFRGEGLMPSGFDAFTQMGLGASLRAIPQARFGGVQLYRGIHPLVIFSTAGMDPPPTVVSQPAMLEMLVGEAARFSNFTLERGATVRDVLHRDGRVAGVIADTADGLRQIAADFVIGTDGRASVIRKRADLHEQRTPQFFDVVWFKVPLPDWQPADFARAWLWRGHAVGAFRTYGDRLQIAWLIDKGAFGELRRMGADGWLDAMTAFVSADFAAHLRANRQALSHPFLLDVICDRLTKWTAPGLLLLGDAAHPMSPVGAQGINIALRDAIVAANHLVPALAGGSKGPLLDEAARRIQDERMPEVVRIQELQQIGPRILFRRSALSRIVLSAPVMSLVRTRLVQSLLAARFSLFLNGVVPVGLQSGI